MTSPSASTADGDEACASLQAFDPSSFERSPGGVSEVSTDWLNTHHCQVRVVDIREHEELVGPLGHLPYADHIPLDELSDAASEWDPHRPVVLVCRSGRRSARGARMLEDLGLRDVASLTGGMLHWHDRGYPVVRQMGAEEAPPVARGEDGEAVEIDRDAIATHLSNPRNVRWVKAAALLLHGTQSCVDGRDSHPVLGTPGGDMGELLLALAASEQVHGEALPAPEVDELLDAYLDSFGRFYMHTDRRALEHLAQELGRDSRFAEVLGEHPSDETIERLVRRPPRQLEMALLEHIIRPANTGCGHLRLILTYPDDYGVRLELAQVLVRAAFRRLWRGDAIDFVVLDGEHNEGAVVNIVLDGHVHPFTRLPTVAPHVGGVEIFVNHPQVSSWLRAMNASFLFEFEPWLHLHPDRQEDLIDAVEALGQTQLEQTLHHLAARLPVFEAHVSEHQIRVEGPIGAPNADEPSADEPSADEPSADETPSETTQTVAASPHE